MELPLGATEDRICGTIDIEKALGEGIKAYEPGLLVRAAAAAEDRSLSAWPASHCSAACLQMTISLCCRRSKMLPTV